MAETIENINFSLIPKVQMFCKKKVMNGVKIIVNVKRFCLNYLLILIAKETGEADDDSVRKTNKKSNHLLFRSRAKAPPKKNFKM